MSEALIAGSKSYSGSICFTVSRVSPETIRLFLAFYSIAFLQRMLEKERNWICGQRDGFD